MMSETTVSSYMQHLVDAELCSVDIQSISEIVIQLASLE